MPTSVADAIFTVIFVIVLIALFIMVVVLGVKGDKVKQNIDAFIECVDDEYENPTKEHIQRCKLIYYKED